MDYEAMDQDMSSWVVVATNGAGRPIFLTENWASPRLRDARRFRYAGQAENAVPGRGWREISVPEALMLCEDGVESSPNRTKET